MTPIEPSDPTFAVGDAVWYFGAWGSHNPVPATITGTGSKNGKRVYNDDTGHWGYAKQYYRRSDNRLPGWRLNHG